MYQGLVPRLAFTVGEAGFCPIMVNESESEEPLYWKLSVAAPPQKFPAKSDPMFQLEPADIDPEFAEHEYVYEPGES